MTRGEVLKYATAFALRRSSKIVRGLKEGLNEDERYAVADHAVAQLKERGDPTPRCPAFRPLSPGLPRPGLLPFGTGREPGDPRRLNEEAKRAPRARA
jgi:hypothetical protein